jgi:Na+/H+-translocating membrane pyrophosphatase
VIGLFLGGVIPFLIAALTVTSVGRAAGQMAEEIRRQFREIPGLLEGRPGVKLDTARCVDISTRAALKEMIIPGCLAVAAAVDSQFNVPTPRRAGSFKPLDRLLVGTFIGRLDVHHVEYKLHSKVVV